MSGYLHFTATGDRAIDNVLAEVAYCGRLYHHTEQWVDASDCLDGKTCIEHIQMTANQEALNRRAEVSDDVVLEMALAYNRVLIQKEASMVDAMRAAIAVLKEGAL